MVKHNMPQVECIQGERESNGERSKQEEHYLHACGEWSVTYCHKESYMSLSEVDAVVLNLF